MTRPLNLIVGETREHAEMIRDSLGLSHSDWDALGLGEGTMGRRLRRIVVFVSRFFGQSDGARLEWIEGAVTTLRTRLDQDGTIKFC